MTELENKFLSNIAQEKCYHVLLIKRRHVTTSLKNANNTDSQGK